MLTIPNALTTARLVATPLLGWWVVQGQYTAAFAGFCAASLSDWLDGYLAKNYDMQSALGVVLDPVADKVLVTTLMVSLAQANLVPLPLTVLVIGRDVGLLAGSFWIRYRLVGVPPWPPHTAKFFDTSDAKGITKPTLTSKLNTAGTFALIGLTMLDSAFGVIEPVILDALCYSVAATTFISGTQYLLMAQRRWSHLP